MIRALFNVVIDMPMPIVAAHSAQPTKPWARRIKALVIFKVPSILV